jgi:hypothetical protein
MARRASGPSLYDIAEAWQAGSELPDAHFRMIGLGEPSCFRCGWLPPVPDTGALLSVNPKWSVLRATLETWKRASRYLDRCHLVDHCATQDNSLTNLVPLCRHPCHNEMPEFGEGQRAKALAWVAAGRRKPANWQMLTDFAGGRGMITSRRQLKPLYIYWIEWLAVGHQPELVEPGP